MSDLASSVCEACRIDAPIVSNDEVFELIKEIEGWELIDNGVKKLKKEFTFSNYRDSVAWWSHKIKGLHKNDFICAAKTNNIYKS